MKKLKLITCIVESGMARSVVASAINAGAGGATVFYGLGTGIRQQLGMEREMTINPEKQIINIVASEENADAIFDAVTEAAELNVPGNGFAYMQSVEKAIGFIGE
ncbi:MAG: P-II family nitrogen regulator [Nitrospirae bacterium]|nr:P-II family nitrogen regulator [Nitrospirota bacterium]